MDARSVLPLPPLGPYVPMERPPGYWASRPLLVVDEMAFVHHVLSLRATSPTSVAFDERGAAWASIFWAGLVANDANGATAASDPNDPRRITMHEVSYRRDIYREGTGGEPGARHPPTPYDREYYEPGGEGWSGDEEEEEEEEEPALVAASDGESQAE